MITTVLGEIEADQLGPTSMHEHVLCDGRVWHAPDDDSPSLTEPPAMSELGPLRWSYFGSDANLTLDDPDLIAAELRLAREAGTSGVVDLTVLGFGRRVRELPKIARASGIHVMVGCGVYIDAAHPPWIADASGAELTSLFVDELEAGIDGTSVRAALIGEIGTSDPITSAEMKVLRAAGTAGAATGGSINVHQTTGQHGIRIVEALLAEGMPADRIILSHMDDDLDSAYHRELLDTGAMIEFDLFGCDAYRSHEERFATDHERADAIGPLLEDGFANQIVLGCDVWTKGSLRAYGGMGYEHLQRRIVPLLRRRAGASEDGIRIMLVENPRRLLNRDREAP